MKFGKGSEKDKDKKASKKDKAKGGKFDVDDDDDGVGNFARKMFLIDIDFGSQRPPGRVFEMISVLAKRGYFHMLCAR